MNQPRPSLELVDVVKDFNGLHADDGASFQVSLGSITGLFGPNRAGRRTSGRWTRVELPQAALAEQLRRHWCSPKK
jgi:ABC-type lipopolysaccharide export system ATPase subunit